VGVLWCLPPVTPVPDSAEAASARPAAAACGPTVATSLLQECMNAVLMQAVLSCEGRAAALTGGGFVLGTILGAVIQNWLRVDIVPLGVSIAA
jgi:hypothetical protein